jgi:hypothetical protein
MRLNKEKKLQMCKRAGMFWMMTKAPRLTKKHWALAPHVSLQHDLHSKHHTGKKTDDIVKKQTGASYSVDTAVLSWRYSNQSIKMTSQHHLLPRLTTSGLISLLPMHAVISQTGVTLPFYIHEL